jgi:CheY-like chemotaxis protein
MSGKPRSAMNGESAIKRVLFVDDSLEYLESIRRGITHWSRGKWELVLTHDTAEAFMILATQDIDLVVSDLCMVTMTGVQFITLVHRQHPHLRKAMLTACEEALSCKESLIAGADLYLIKPRTVAGFETVFHSLDQLFATHQPGLRGLLHKVSLTDLIQLECLNGRSSVLEVSFRGRTSFVYIKQGRLIHAQAGSLTGPAAIIRLMRIPGGDFELKNFSEPGEHTIKTSWEQILLEAAQAADEGGSQQADQAWMARAAAPVPAPVETPEESAPAPAVFSAPPSRRPRAAEVLVLNAGDQPLFDWQCARLLQKNCRSLCDSFSMGTPALVDLQQSTGRALAHFEPGRVTFARTEYLNPATPQEADHV